MTVAHLRGLLFTQVLVMPSFSHSSHLTANMDDPSAGWWTDMVGPDKFIDTKCVRLLLWRGHLWRDVVTAMFLQVIPCALPCYIGRLMGHHVSTVH